MNCPHCQRVLYSRQHPRCGYCGGDLPANLMLSAREVDDMKAEMREIEERSQKAKEKEAQEREAARQRRNMRSAGNFPPIP